VPVIIDRPGIVSSISVYSASQGTTYVSGIYNTDVNGLPGTLLGQTADAAFNLGVNANNPSATLAIPKAGTYWIAASYAGVQAGRLSHFTGGTQNVRTLTNTSYSTTLPANVLGGGGLSSSLREFTAYIELLGYDAIAEGGAAASAVGGGILASAAISSGFATANAVRAIIISIPASAVGSGTGVAVSAGPGTAAALGIGAALAMRGDPKGIASGIASALAVGAGPLTNRFSALGASTGNAVSVAAFKALAYAAGKGTAEAIGPPCPGPPLPAQSFSDLLSAPSGDILLPSIISQTPRGAAWRTDEQNDSSHLSFQHRFWRAVADPVADLYAKAWKLALSSTALTIQDDLGNDALGDWEVDHGLPNACLKGENLTRDRRKLLLRQHISGEPIVAHGGQSIQYFICIALELGYAITIGEFTPLRCGQGRCGHTQ
ncbi:MAG: hypothetical protein L0Z53_21150, partial [Acidobacteriales bacterium]|nr:hypothetical protein [Terriglobales bacterium]